MTASISSRKYTISWLSESYRQEKSRPHQRILEEPAEEEVQLAQKPHWNSELVLIFSDSWLPCFCPSETNDHLSICHHIAIVAKNVIENLNLTNPNAISYCLIELDTENPIEDLDYQVDSYFTVVDSSTLRNVKN